MSDPALVDPSSTVNMILKKAKTPLGKRSLMKKAPKLVETEGKMCLLLHGGKSSQVLKDLVTDIGVLKKGECHKLTRKNEGIRPFEGGGETSLEFFAQKADAGAFMLGTDQKKRPDCLTVGRFFDYHLFDMVELLVTNYKGIDAFGNVASQTVLEQALHGVSRRSLRDGARVEAGEEHPDGHLPGPPGDAGEPQGRRPRHHLHRPRE